ncbi:MAG TPA: gliding motility-associated C-terminal domain-containing protein [Bacteroidales bacterium]|nr:gliding motility-associated C-terminal domain-containing protein [Bacteroidales bacterium]
MKIKNLIFCCLLLLVIQTCLKAQLLYNNGVTITITKGVVVYVGGTVQNESGQIAVDNVSGTSELVVIDDFINNSTAGGSGYYRVYGDWINNLTFNAGTGTVFLQGGNQILGGISSTYFYDLTLDGTDVKTQTIHQYCTHILDLNDVELSTATFGFYMQNTDVAAIVFGNGFVSSLNSGFLSRKTNLSQNYIFPVGSSVGTVRYRPVELRPTTVTANTYTVRMANVDATTETFDRDAREADICEINPLFYHQINRTAGTAATDLNIYYDNAADGVWEGLSNWSTTPDQWEIITGSTITTGSPLYKATKLAWNDFSQIPYALYATVPDAIAGGGSVCEGEDIMLTETGGDAVSWSWEGPDGFTSTDHNPVISPASLASNGFYSVTVTNAHGCTNSDGLTIKVDAAVDATITPAGPFCETNIPVTLTAASSGGTWSGTGITNPATGEFTPTGAVGDNIITYNVTNGACSDSDTETIHVDATVDATITAAGPFCESASAVTLTAASAGGTWSGDGITNPATGEFTPGSAAIGDNVITYDIVNGACSDSDTETIHVDSDVDATITPAGPLCETASAVTLTAASAGGTWSGNGITNPATGEFTPGSAAIGDNVITYDIINGACSDSDTETIHVDSDVDATITAAGPFCETASAVTLTAASAGGTWSGTGITNPATGEFTPTGAAGDNIITYDISNGACTDNDTETIHVDTDVDATITPAGPFCESGIPVTLLAASAGGTWSGTGITNPATGEFTPTGAAGDNIITYDITNGACSDNDTEIIHVDTDVDATITPIGPFCTSDAPVALVAVTGGGIWAGTGVTGSNFNPNSAGDGTHNVTYNVSNGACSDSDDIDVEVNENPAVPVTSVDCTGGVDQGIITVTSPVGADFEYTIDGSYQVSPIFGPLLNGSYTVTVQDITSGCISVGSGDNLDCGCPTPTTLTLSSYVGNTCGIEPKTVSGNTFGGSATQVNLGHNGNGSLDQTTIAVSPFEFTYTPDVADIGNVVTITVTTDNPEGPPCSSNVKTYLLTVKSLPNVVAGNSTPVCDGGSVTLTETGGVAISWAWEGPNLFSSSNHNPVISGISPANSGNYVVTVTGINGCTNSDDVDITVNLNPVITLGSNSPICEGDDIHLTETGGEATSWVWTGPNGAVPSVQNPDILAAVPADGGLYTVVVTDINSCTSTDNITVVVDNDVDATITTTGPFCENEAVVTLAAITAGGVWSGTSVSGNTFDPSIGEGDYTISYVVTNGVCSDNDDVVLHVDEVTDVTITAAGPFCETGPAVILTAATPGGTWSGNGISDPATGEFTPGDANIGVNTISYVIINGACTDTDTEDITVDELIDASITTTGPFCENEGSITLLSVNPGGTWTGTGVTGNTFDPSIGEGDYNINYEIINGTCSDDNDVLLHVDSEVDATITPIGPFCGFDGCVALVAATPGGVWSGTGVIGNNFCPSVAGEGIWTIDYDVSNGACSDNDDINITVNENPTAPVTSIDCSGGEDQGIITVTAPLGADYEYSIDGNYQAGVTFGPLTNGNYTVTVEDVTTGCTTEGTPITLNCGCDNPPTLSLSANTGNLCPNSDITVSGNTFGGSATQVDLIHNGEGSLDVASVTVSPFSFTYTPAPADAGTTITITLTTDNPDGAPCVAAVQTYILTVYSDVPSVIAGGNSPICVGENINLSEIGGDAISWDWEGPNGFTSDEHNPEITAATIAAGGLYTVTVTDIHGCENSDDVTITVNDLPAVPVATTDCSGGTDNGIITVTSPLGASYEYSIGGGFQASPIFGSLANGNYTITVNDINTGCSVAGNVINLDCSGCSNPTTLALSADSDATCVEDVLTLSGNTFGGSATQVTLSHDGNGDIDQTTISTSPFSFTYTPDISDAGNTVTITITTNNPVGDPCVASIEEFELTVYDIPTANVGSNSPVCQGDDINLTETGGDAVNWAWTGPNSFTSNDNNPEITEASLLATGTYSVVISDANGCTATDNIDITIIENVDVEITDPGIFCSDASAVDLEAIPAGGVWSGDGVNPVTGAFDPGVSGIGNIEITYTIGGSCGGTDVIFITVIPRADAEITNPGTICLDGSTTDLEATPAGGLWSGDGVDPLTGTFDSNISGVGNIEITYTIGGSCGDADTIHITVLQRADASITDPVDSLFVIDPAVMFTAEQIGGTWSGTAINEFTGEFSPQDAGIGSYWIFYTISGVCGDIDSTLVAVLPEIIPDLLIPDVLTPNNDGYNDTWRIQGIKAFEDVDIVIFNRWGDEVFMFTGTGNAYAEVQNQWDGMRNGKELPFGTYVYVLVLNNEDTYKGTVTIIR